MGEVRGREAVERPVLAGVLGERRHVEAGRVVHARRDVADRDHACATLVKLGRGNTADVPEALHDEGEVGEVPAEALAGAVDHHHDSSSCCLAAKERPSDRDRLPGHDPRNGVALLGRVGVHHPGHRLLVRGDVRSRDVDLRPDERREVRGEAARHARRAPAARADAGCSGRLPSRRRRAAAGARTSRSSTSQAPRTRRARPPRRSGSLPSSARAPRSAARGRRGTSGGCRRPSAPAA